MTPPPSFDRQRGKAINGFEASLAREIGILENQRHDFYKVVDRECMQFPESNDHMSQCTYTNQNLITKTSSKPVIWRSEDLIFPEKERRSTCGVANWTNEEKSKEKRYLLLI